MDRAREGWAFIRLKPRIAVSLSDSGVATALSALRQKRRAAEVLYESDCPAEALRMTGEALEAIESVASAACVALALPLAKDDARTEATLRACGLSALTVDEFVALRARHESGLFPSTDAAIAAQDVEHLESALQICRSVECVFVDLNRPPSQRIRARIARVVAPLGLALIIAALLWLVWLELDRWPTATASSTYQDLTVSHGPKNVCDLRAETEWLPADRSRGWVELALFRPREVHAVVLRNGHNPPFNDRAIRNYRVELYQGETLLARARGRFATLEPAPSPVTIDVHAKRVDRVRVVIESFHGLGAALAEVEIR